MARCKTYQDFEDDARDEKLFRQICNETPDAVFGNHARRLDVIDRIVDSSREGSLSNGEAQQQAELLFSMRGTMTRDEFYAAQQVLDVLFQNNLEHGLANSFYDEWVRDERRDK